MQLTFINDGGFLRSRAGRLFLRYAVLCVFLAASLGVGFHYLNIRLFERNKIEEKLTAIQLVDAFVANYSAIRAEHFGTKATVPAAFRADAIERFNGQRNGEKKLRLVMVGPPGLEIVTPPLDDDMAATIRGFLGEAAPQPVSRVVEVNGQMLFRTIVPSLATQQSCVDCHNQQHAGKAVWKLGDVMGAFAIDAPMDAFLAESRRDSTIVAVVAFIVLVGVGLYIARLHSRQLAERELSEARVRESEERFRDFAEIASDWFWEQDENLRFSYLSNAVQKSGLPAHDHLGKTRQEVIHRGVSPEQWAAHQADLDARRPFSSFQFERLGPNGEVRDIRIAGKPVFAPDGTFRGYRGIARDVTVEVATEKELERRVAERTGELRAAQGELLRAERLATLGRLTATVSHELRNPLGVIRNSVFTIAEAARTGGLKLDRPLERIDRSIKRCDGIISELLDYTRVRDLQRESVAVDAWLSELLDEQKMPTGIALARRLDAPGITVSCDPNRLRRAVINLVENAAHALADSTGKSAAREGAVVTVLSGASDGRLEIAVRDNGPGIPLDVLPKIFEPLFSTKSFGVGLGLPTVKQIMEQHGGGIDVAPLDGGGTEVKLWLALAEPMLEAAE